MRIHFKKHIKSVHFGMIFSSRPAVEKIWENDKLFIKGIITAVGASTATITITSGSKKQL